MPKYDVIIAGGGNSAGYVCRELVAQKYAGSVLVIGSEAVAPYERPALTKAYIHPPTAKVRARLPGFHTCVGVGGDRQEPPWYKEHNISLRLNTLVTAVDTAAKSVTTNNGDTFQYGTLVHACGSDTIRLSDFKIPGDGTEGVYYLREEHDAKSLVDTLEQLKLKEGAKVVIIGGGFIGLEVAAAIRGWDFATTAISLGPIMQPFFPPHLTVRMTDEYQKRNVTLVQGVVAEVVRNESEKQTEVRLADGRVLAGDLVVVGIGARAKVIVQNAECVGGCLTVDESMRTSLPDVLAIGDSAAPMVDGERMRFQAVDWARKSATFAAKTICGVKYDFSYLPFNYSRVFEYTDKPIVWNFFGKSSGDVVKVKTSTETSIGAFWIKDGRVNGALILGSPMPTAEEFEEAKRLVVERAEVPKDGSFPSKQQGVNISIF
eukprot:GEMP01024576.1.p1 GENE.GEMP01024576.1~~GEMP01024576.1.p1  ORF type:complete len:432 (+),score=128.33 GEMP01024576.1:136-1431(+)